MGIYIAAAIALIVLALLFTKIRLLLCFSGGDISLAVKILFFRINITEKAEKRINKRSYKIKKFRRRRDRALKKYKIKSAAKKKRSEGSASEPSAEATKKKIKNPKQLINTIWELLGDVIKRFPRHLHIEFKKLIIGVGGKDASDIALKTAAVMQMVQYLVSSLESLTNVRKTKGGQVCVYPMFAEGTWSAEVDISAYIRVGNVLRLGIIFIKNYLKHKSKKKK